MNRPEVSRPEENRPASTPAEAVEERSLLRRALSLLGKLAFFLFLFVCLQAVLGWVRAPRLPTQAPAFALSDLEGETVTLSDFSGRTVVLNFWATWCGPCRVEIPSFTRFAAAHPEIPVLGVAVDGSVEELRRARDDLGIGYPVLVADRATLEAYGISSLPTTVVVRGDGSVKSAHAGMLFGPQLWWLTR